MIKLSGNQVGDEGAKALAGGLARLRPHLLAELHMLGCGIGPEGMGHLLGALVRQGNLLHLHLAGNVGWGRGAQSVGASAALAQLLQQTKKLEELCSPPASNPDPDPNPNPDPSSSPSSNSSSSSIPIPIPKPEPTPTPNQVTRRLGRRRRSARRRDGPQFSAHCACST